MSYNIAYYLHYRRYAKNMINIITPSYQFILIAERIVMICWHSIMLSFCCIHWLHTVLSDRVLFSLTHLISYCHVVCMARCKFFFVICCFRMYFLCRKEGQWVTCNKSMSWNVYIYIYPGISYTSSISLVVICRDLRNSSLTSVLYFHRIMGLLLDT